MALKDSWENKVNGVDYVDANDVNGIANAVIKLENDMGDIETALDSIIQQQISIEDSQDVILATMRGT